MAKTLWRRAQSIRRKAKDYVILIFDPAPFVFAFRHPLSAVRLPPSTVRPPPSAMVLFLLADFYYPNPVSASFYRY